MKKIITSESVNCGHPDKTCDIISDTFLDQALLQDENSQMAVECAIKDDLLMIYGEATTKAQIDYEIIARKILKELGYKNDFRIVKQISHQSPQINNAVNKKQLGANDQGIMYGYATNESEEYLPLTIVIAHSLMKEYEQFRQKHNQKYFSDAKSQVTIEYKKDSPAKIKTVLISVSHDKDLTLAQIKQDIISGVINKVLKKYDKLYDKSTKLIINPSGKFSIWGSFSDSGCVGRKIVVDTYGGIGRVGGGCFSSKNATKVDRSGAYYARYVAKNIVAHGFADRCEIQLSYGIGIAKPISVFIDTYKTNKVSMKHIYEYINKNFDFSVENIITELNLKKPGFAKTACYGHFGNSEYSWEKIKPMIE